MAKNKEEESELIFLLEDLEPDSKPKPEFTYTEVAPNFAATGLRRIYYKLDGAVHSSIILQGIMNGLPTNGSLLGWDERVVMSVDKADRRPSVLHWRVDDLPDRELEAQLKKEETSTKKKVLPRAVPVCDLRLLGDDEKNGPILQKQDLGRMNLPEGLKISRMMQVAHGMNATFTWVDIKKRKETSKNH